MDFSWVKNMQDYKKVKQNEYGQSVGTEVLHPQPISYIHRDLSGQHVQLRAIERAGISALQSQQLWQTLQHEPDASCWTYLPYSGFATTSILQQCLKQGFNFPSQMHYLIEVEQQCCGWVALLNFRPQQHVIEIGNVYFSNRLKQTCAATETIYLLLKDCFDQGIRRVEWKCDELNTPSYRAALRFGFEYEGTFRQDRISKGRNRNTAWFSILDEEWPALEKAYLQWLSPDNFDENAQQKIRLSEFILSCQGE